MWWSFYRHEPDLYLDMNSKLSEIAIFVATVVVTLFIIENLMNYGKTVTSLVSALHYNHGSEPNWLK
jgi:hypothetical protein